MPKISFFYGISIYMYFLGNEHNPAHIHATYAGNNVIIDILTGEILEGTFPKNAIKLVRQWIKLHKDELEQMWNTQEFKKIAPLE